MGIQFLKAYGYNVIGIDISDATLEGAKSCGADHVFNSQTQSDYVEQVRKIAGGKGCHAAINYTNSVPAYLATPPLLRAWGVLMVTGIPQQPIPFHAMDLAMGGMRVRGSNNGTTPRLLKCVEFAHKHGIKPHVTNYKLEQFQEMVETMQANKHQGRRLGVVFE
jgi:propanol-preferring alcohol dehydrogenase